MKQGGDMEGIFLNRGGARGVSVDSGAGIYGLLAKQGPMEIIRLLLEAGDVIWLSPADDPAVLEFFFIHTGALEIALPDGAVRLEPGDSFYMEGLSADIPVRAESATELVYVTNCPMFDSARQFQDSLRQLLVQINEKDHYTYRHSGSVMHYTQILYERLKKDFGSVPLDDLNMASLFHDVGKCFVPVEILQKKGRLEPDEIRIILRHPRDSARLLKPHFGSVVAEIAGNHHERLDGSGYPCGLTAQDISFPARVLAVADVFDAMTSNRGYNRIKPPLEAARELCSLSNLYDIRITRALMDLVQRGELTVNGGNP